MAQQEWESALETGDVGVNEGSRAQLMTFCSFNNFKY